MSTILKFNTLQDLASYVKAIRPEGYTLNTLNLTLTSILSEFEMAVAIEQFGASPQLTVAVA